MSDPAKSSDLTKKPNTAIEAEGAKSKKDEVAARKDVVGDPATQEAVAKVLNGEMGVEEAQKQFPDILTILQGTVGNEFVDILVKGGAKKKPQSEEKKDETSKAPTADGKKDEKPAAPVDPEKEAEAKMTALVLGIVGAKMGIGHLLKNREAKEAADPSKKEADDKKKEGAEKKTDPVVEKKDDKKDEAAEKKDTSKKVDDLKKTDAKDEKEKKDTSSSKESKDQADKVKEQAKDTLTKDDKKEPAADKKDTTSQKDAKDPAADKKDTTSQKDTPEKDKKDTKDPASEKKEPGGEKKDPGAEKKDPGAEKKEEPGGEKKDGGGGEKKTEPGGGASTEVQDPAPQPVTPPPQMVGPGGTMDAFMANNPDKGARDRVTNAGYTTDKLERSSKELGGKVELPPDKAWYDAVTPRQDWFALKQKIKNNPWSGQDKVMAFMHNFNAGLDFVSSAVSKIGLACTVGGVILTFLVPPVGAFLLTVGRVANAISVVLSGLKLIVSIVQTIMLAVKAAKEKDPIKRMEMMQQMKSSLQSGVMAGIDLILSKVGGGAKGAASNAGGKAMDAAKSAFKDARAAGKGMMGAGLAGLKAGGGAFVKGMGTAMKEGFQGMKNSAKEGMKSLGSGLKELAKNPLKTIGGGIKAGFQSMKGAVVKPFSDIKTAWQGFSSVGKSWKQFTSGVAKNGYLKTIGQMNFKNAMGGKTFTDKLKGAYKDVTDKSAGGAATQIDMFMNGKSDKNKGKNNKGEVENHAREAKAKQQELEKAMSGNITQQRQYLAKSQDKKYSDLRHLDDSTVKVMMQQKQKELKKSMSFGPQMPGLSQAMDLGVGAYKTYKGDKSASDMVKTGLESSQSGALGTAAKFMVNSKSVGGDKKSLLEEAAETNSARTQKAIETAQTSVQSKYKGGLTEAKCKSAMTPALGIMSKREAELQGLMAQSGQKPAGPAPETEAKAPEAQQGPPPPPPPPPAPPEGTVVPEESLLADIKGQRDKLSGIKSNVQGSIKRAEEQKAQAIKGDATLTQYAAGLDKQQAEVTQQEAEATKDKAEITQAKGKIAEGGKQVADKKGVADGEKGKASAKAAEGSQVNAVPDKAKQQAEEKKRAAEEKAKEEAEWKKAGMLKKAWLGAKKFVKTIGDFIASAAKWVWEKMIAPAIAAVKKAIASVMNAITNMLMSGIIKIIGAIMGKEAENNLNATFAQMKEMEAAQAKAAATETKGKNTEAKLKLTKAQQAAKAKVDTCQANIAEGKALIGEIDAHDAALQAEEKKVVADREAFRAQYSPYFDWVKIYEEWQAKNGETKDKPKEQPKGDGKTPSGPANEGPKSEGEHPADRPLESTVSLALSSAAEVVKTESQESQGAVATAAKEKADALKAAAKGAYDANMADLKAASEKEKTKDMSELYGKENDKVSKTNSNADQVVAAVTSSHGKTESERRARIDALIARAQGLTGKKANEGLQEAKEIWKLISEEAKGIEPSQAQALKDLADGFDKMKAG